MLLLLCLCLIFICISTFVHAGLCFTCIYYTIHTIYTMFSSYVTCSSIQSSFEYGARHSTACISASVIQACMRQSLYLEIMIYDL